MTTETTARAEEATEASMTDLIASRATMYDLLARVFHKEVDAAFLDTLNTMRYPQGLDNPTINEAFRRVYAFVRHAREDTLDVLSMDYSRIFLGSGVLNGNAAYPYESVYTSTHGLIMQDARDEVLAIYRSQCVDKDEAWKDPEDHIALELEFMAVLSRRCAEALAGEDDNAARALVQTQYRFLADHLLRWAPNFLGDVPKYASVDFYPAFSALTRAWLDDERALLEDIAEASGIDLAPAPFASTATSGAKEDCDA